MRPFFTVLTIVALLASSALLAAGCASSASDAKLEAMCAHLFELRGGAVPSEAEVVAEVEEDFAAKKKHLEDWKARDMKGWDEELAEKLAEAESDEDEQALEEEYEKKKKIGADQFDQDIEELEPKKKEALAAAKAKNASLLEAREAEIKECVDGAKAEGVSRALAECRAEAESTDEYWNVCK